MNLRTQELAKQSTDEILGVKILDQKKFAELIVQECCQKLEDDGMVEVAMEMKQHFGVEE